MNKKTVFKIIMITIVIVALVFSVWHNKKISLTGKQIIDFNDTTPDPNEYELAHNHTNISTAIGLINPPWGVLVNGTPTNFTTLNVTTQMNTTNGTRTFYNGTRISCEALPHEPDPCGAS